MGTTKKTNKTKQVKKKVAKSKVARKEVTRKKATKRKEPEKKSVKKSRQASIITSTSVNSNYQSPPNDSKQTAANDSKQTAAEIKPNVEQPKEDIMSNGYIPGPGDPGHQTPLQEDTFQAVLRDLCNDATFREKVLTTDELGKYALSPEQKVALIAVGHATGKYKFDPSAGRYCCCCG